MKIFFTLLFLSAIAQVSFASADTVKIPINRKIFHEKIDKEQQLTDKADGRTR